MIAYLLLTCSLLLGTPFPNPSSNIIVDDILYESAWLGPTGINGLSQVDPNGIKASRFTLLEPAVIESVGGHLAAPEGQTIFAVIIALDEAGGMPGGFPFDPAEIRAVTTFAPGTPSSDFHTPVNVYLEPGHYALAFGGGMFGATTAFDSATMVNNNIPKPDATFMHFGENFFGVLGWHEAPGARLRFVVKGVGGGPSIPAASSATLIVTALLLLGAATLVYRRRRLQGW